MKQLIRYLIWFLLLFAGYNSQAQNNTVYGAGISYTNGAPTWAPNPRTSRAAVDTVTGRWYHFNTPGGWQWIGNTVEEIAGCAAPAYTPSKGDSRLVINNCVKPQVYWYDGAAWKWINEGTTYFGGEGIRIENDTIILDSLYVLRFRTGDTTDLNAGAVSWNAGEQTLDVVINQGAVTGQMFQEVLYFTKNQTGTQIDDGTVVMAVGTTGNSGKILIAPAIADGSVNSEYILGLATQNLPNGGEGMVTHFGKVRGIQTNGANFGETWVDGDVLYCSASTPGYLTKVLPTAPSLKVPIAIVIHAHPSNGTLFVRPSHFPDLAQINDVQLSSLTNGQVLTYNSTLSRWENATPANQLQTLSTDNTPGNISISSGNTITLNVNDADASTTNELQTLSVAANTATLSNSGGSVTIAGAGINTVGTAGTTITVTGTEVDGSTTNELQTLSTGTNTLTLSNGGGTVTVDTDPTNDVTGSGASGQVSFWTGAQTQSGDNNLFWDNTNKSLGIGNTAPGANAIRITKPLGGNTIAGQVSAVGEIQSAVTSQANYFLSNATTQAASFTLSSIRHFAAQQGTFGAGSVVTVQTGFRAEASLIGANVNYGFWSGLPAGSNRYNFYANGTADNYFAGNTTIGSLSTPARLHVVGSGASSTTWTAQFHNSAGNNNALMIRDDGNVGVGTNAPGARLEVNGNAFINNGSLGIGTTNFNTVKNINIFKNVTGGTSLTGFQNIGIVLSDVTTQYINYSSASRTTGGFTLGNYTHYLAGESSIDPLTTISNQYGFSASISTGTNIYNFFANTNAATGRWNFYAAGTARNYFAGNTAIGTTTQDASAAFEVASTTQGVLFPRMTTAQRDLITTPANGLVIYNTSTDKLQVRAAGAWVDLH